LTRGAKLIAMFALIARMRYPPENPVYHNVVALAHGHH